ncbi:MAG TPA: hypothetical protein VKX31_09925 [Brumimicrobium sp.]|nr:hypothetical protein [Brumimicrobium sp.]
MNKIYNSWVFIASILALLYAFFASMYDTFGIFVKIAPFIERLHKEYVFGFTALFIFLLNARRSYKKWTGMAVVNKTNRFLFNTPISKDRKKTVILYNTLEIFTFLILGIGFVLLSLDATIITLVFFLVITDMGINFFLGINSKKYRIGMTKKAIVTADREVLPIYFKGLKRITKQGIRLYFEYVNDLVLDINIESIPPEKQEEFINLLRETVDEKKVYFSGF